MNQRPLSTGEISGLPRSAPSNTLSHSIVQKSQKRRSSRQQLSCNKCKERKVKCDRTQPCSACCARGQPRDCVFDCEGDFTPTSQGDEIRRLRKENEKLKCMIRDHACSEDAEKSAQICPQKAGVSDALCERIQKASQSINSVYFGTPSLNRLVTDLGKIDSATMIDLNLPEELQIPASYGPSDPFWAPTGSSIAEIVTEFLGDHDSIYQALDVYQRRASTCCFPYRAEGTEKDVCRIFLADPMGNANTYPQTLAMILAATVSGLQMSIFNDRGNLYQVRNVDRISIQCRNQAAAAMQALRLSSFTSAPTLYALQALIIIGTYLINDGRVQDAWTLFGTTIRTAYSLGLHRDPGQLLPKISLREGTMRKKLWWCMLHMDQQFSVTLGRPLGISGIGDCSPPESLSVDPSELRLTELVHHLTIIARQIISHQGMLTITKRDELTDKLLELYDMVPAMLKFEKSWVLEKKHVLPDHPLCMLSAILFARIQSLLTILNDERNEISKARKDSQWTTVGATTTHANQDSERAGRDSQTRRSRPSHTTSHMRGRALVVESSANILQVFCCLYNCDSVALICWNINQQAFYASLALLIDAHETQILDHLPLIQEVLQIFTQLRDSKIHRLAGIAVSRIGQGFHHVEKAYRQKVEMSQQADDRTIEQPECFTVNEYHATVPPELEWLLQTMSDINPYFSADSSLTRNSYALFDMMDTTSFPFWHSNPFL